MGFGATSRGWHPIDGAHDNSIALESTNIVHQRFKNRRVILSLRFGENDVRRH